MHAIIKDKDESFIKNISAGMLSGAIANGIANPTDVLKVRMQSNQAKFVNKSLWTCFKEIYALEKFGGLYRVVKSVRFRVGMINYPSEKGRDPERATSRHRLRSRAVHL